MSEDGWSNCLSETASVWLLACMLLLEPHSPGFPPSLCCLTGGAHAQALLCTSAGVRFIYSSVHSLAVLSRRWSPFSSSVNPFS
eukprot:scaffold67975_cov19-Tisochrysis_lutea.AAC.1